MTSPDVDPAPVEPTPAALATLPDGVRRRVLDVVAQALGALEPAQVPMSLTQVARFAPGRRAAAGAVPLSAAIERDDVFRAAVARYWKTVVPDLAQTLDDDDVLMTSDPIQVAVGAYLTRGPRWRDQLARALGQLADQHAAQVVRADEEQVLRLREQLEAALKQLDQLRDSAERERSELAAELVSVRRELRRHRADADRARSQARSALDAAAEQSQRAVQDVERAQQTARRLQLEVDEARTALADARRADRQGRSLAGSRAWLLLDTVVEAATGLRRELGLPPADVLPGDLVGHDPVGVGAADLSPRARSDDDPAVLAELLTLPQAHLVVDGYNVTLSNYPTLPLADQRTRLLAGLSSVHARTRAEITCCFDGARVDGRVAPPNVRGVRVRFSEPGTTADELIRRLVRAEPTGRVVVVVSSDREVATRARADGARAVPSAALARLLERS